MRTKKVKPKPKAKTKLLARVTRKDVIELLYYKSMILKYSTEKSIFGLILDIAFKTKSHTIVYGNKLEDVKENAIEFIFESFRAIEIKKMLKEARKEFKCVIQTKKKRNIVAKN